MAVPDHETIQCVLVCFKETFKFFNCAWLAIISCSSCLSGSQKAYSQFFRFDTIKIWQWLAPRRETLKISPVQIDIFKIVQAPSRKSVIPVVVSLRLIKVDELVCKIDNWNKIIEWLTSCIRTWYSGPLIDCHIFRTDDEELSSQQVKSLFQFYNGVCHYPRRSQVRFNVQINSIEPIFLNNIAQRVNEIVD